MCEVTRPYVLIYIILHIQAWVYHVEGDIIYPSIDMDTRDITYKRIPAYSMLKWNYAFKEVTNMTVIDLQLDQSVFDYCDLTQYTREGILPLLSIYYNISEGDLEAGRMEWLALSPSYVCPSPTIMSMLYSTNPVAEAMPLCYGANTIVSYIQNMGALGLIDTYVLGFSYNYFTNMDQVDNNKGIAYGIDVNSMIAIAIPSNTAELDDFYTAKDNFMAINESFVIQSVSHTPNPDFEDVFNPKSSIYYYQRVGTAIACIISLLTFIDTCGIAWFVVRRTRRIHHKKRFTYAALFFGTIGSLARIVLLVDPNPIYGIIPYSVNTALISIGVTFHVAASASSKYM